MAKLAWRLGIRPGRAPSRPAPRSGPSQEPLADAPERQQEAADQHPPGGVAQPLPPAARERDHGRKEHQQQADVPDGAKDLLVAHDPAARMGPAPCRGGSAGQRPGDLDPGQGQTWTKAERARLETSPKWASYSRFSCSRWPDSRKRWNVASLSNS